jgi:antitoxin VapB
MALRVSNPAVVPKVAARPGHGPDEDRYRRTAIDRLAGETQGASDPGRLSALLAQLDRVPDRPDAFDPLEWDGHGLPK